MIWFVYFGERVVLLLSYELAYKLDSYGSMVSHKDVFDTQRIFILFRGKLIKFISFSLFLRRAFVIVLHLQELLLYIFVGICSEIGCVNDLEPKHNIK